MSGLRPSPGMAAQVYLFRFRDFLGTEVFDASRAIEVGRDRNADLVLDADTVSRQHCRLLLIDGDLYVEDCKSANGTLLNEVRVEGRIEVEPRDSIQIGPFTLKARLISPAKKPGPSFPVDAPTRVEAVLNGDGQRAETIDVAEVDGRLYDDAVRRRTGAEAPRGLPRSLVDPANSRFANPASKPVSHSDEVGPHHPEQKRGPRTEDAPQAMSIKEHDNASTRPMGAEIATRLRDLDELIAALDRRAKHLLNANAMKPWREEPRIEPQPEPLAPTSVPAPRNHRSTLSNERAFENVIELAKRRPSTIDRLDVDVDVEVEGQGEGEGGREADAHAQARGNADANAGGDANAHAHTHAHTHADADADAKAKAEAEAKAKPKARAGAGAGAGAGADIKVEVEIEAEEETEEGDDVPHRTDDHHGGAEIDSPIPARRHFGNDGAPSPSIKFAPLAHEAHLLTPTDMRLAASFEEFVSHEPPSASGALLSDVWTRSSAPPPEVAALESPEFGGLEVSARVGSRIRDVAILRNPGDQYILGYPTPQGARAPGHAHLGLRLLRINDDWTIDLVFPRDVKGHLVRGATTVMFAELTEGRRYSCLRLEPKDRAMVILGDPGQTVSYLVRFLDPRRATA